MFVLFTFSPNNEINNNNNNNEITILFNPDANDP